MTPAQFQARVKKGTVPAATLLLGPEAYERRRIKDALMGTVPADAVSQHDLAELTLAEILDDARALSLFDSQRGRPRGSRRRPVHPLREAAD